MKNSNLLRSFPTRLSMLAILLLGSACANLNRSSDSGYADRNAKAPTNFKRSSKITEQKIGDRGAMNISKKTQLKKMENSLSNKKEIEQYSKALPWFRDEEERIEFLAEPGFESRQKWLTDHSFHLRSGAVKTEMQDLVEAQDIAVGMPQALVRQSWGDPDAVEVSGNPQFKNERWKYSRFVSTQDGYKPEKKIVYFEGGRVVGWELE